MSFIDSDTIGRHEIVLKAGGFLRPPMRGIIEVVGGDRMDWLHNLVTNVVRSLQQGDGNYAFAVNTQGRTVFDLNVLVLDDRLWLDVDRRWIGPALNHLNKYIIVEDVALQDASSPWTRVWVLGPATPRLVESLGMGNNFRTFADLQHISAEFKGYTLRLVKNNLGPILRAEFYVPSAVADAFHASVAERARTLGMTDVDSALFEMIRIEVGVPASLADIDDQVIPPETRQVERGVSYVKGCYLGQEVLERMRSRGSMARRLVGLKVSGERCPPRNAPVFAGEKEIGRATSACRSAALSAVLALGYVKTAYVDADQPLQVAIDEVTAAPAEIVDLPVGRS